MGTDEVTNDPIKGDQETQTKIEVNIDLVRNETITEIKTRN